MKLSRHCLPWSGLLAALAWNASTTPPADSACCYFSAKDKDILQPAQKVFLTYDPATKVETWTVQPKFEGNAADFGMVIPSPARPKLAEMPRDFFKELAVFTILKKREFPFSKLLPQPDLENAVAATAPVADLAMGKDGGRLPAIKILESGVVGSLDYKIIDAGRADDLFDWLKDNKYSYSGDEATLDYYVKKKWVFTVMKIDTMQMKKNADGSFAGEVTPTRFTFETDQFVYPLKITQMSVKDQTEALFYVQAPTKIDLEGDLSYRYNWIPLLQSSSGCTPGGLPGGAGPFLEAIKDQAPAITKKAQELGFAFAPGQRPQPNKKGTTPTTLEWARRLTDNDIKALSEATAYSEKVPDVDEGFSPADLKNEKRAQAIYKTIEARLAKSNKEHPKGYLVREAPADDVKQLKILSGHLREGQFLTKFRKVFTKGEMSDDLVLVPAVVGKVDDKSEYEEILPTSPP